MLRSKSIPASLCRAIPMPASNPPIVSEAALSFRSKASPTAWSKPARTETPHGAKVSDQPFKLVVTYTVEKDKPLATNVAE